MVHLCQLSRDTDGATIIGDAGHAATRAPGLVGEDLAQLAPLSMPKITMLFAASIAWTAAFARSSLSMSICLLDVGDILIHGCLEHVKAARLQR